MLAIVNAKDGLSNAYDWKFDGACSLSELNYKSTSILPFRQILWICGDTHICTMYTENSRPFNHDFVMDNCYTRNTLSSE